MHTVASSSIPTCRPHGCSCFTVLLRSRISSCALCPLLLHQRMPHSMTSKCGGASLLRNMSSALRSPSEQLGRWLAHGTEASPSHLSVDCGSTHQETLPFAHAVLASEHEVREAGLDAPPWHELTEEVKVDVDSESEPNQPPRGTSHNVGRAPSTPPNRSAGQHAAPPGKPLQGGKELPEPSGQPMRPRSLLLLWTSRGGFEQVCFYPI